MAVDSEKNQPRAGSLPDPRPALAGALDAGAGSLGRLWSRHEVLLGLALLWAFGACIMIVDWIRPVYGWDMLAYMAIAVRDAFPNAADLHAYVYDVMKAGSERTDFVMLTGPSDYRVRQFTDADAFVSQLGMYEVKWLYVKLVALAAPVAGLIRAPFIVNVGSALLFFGALTWWMRATRLSGFAPLVVAGLLMAQFPGMLMAETPDMLTAALTLAAMLAFDRDRQIVGTLALVLSVAARPDSAAVCGVLMAAAWFWNDRLVRAATIGFVASVAIYYAVTHGTSHPGWWPHVWFTAYQMQGSMAGFHPDFSPYVYAYGLVWNLVRAAVENTWLGVYVGALFAVAIGYARGWRFSKRRTVLVAAMLVAVPAKYVVFPIHDGRVFLPLLIPALLLMLAEAHRLMRGEGSKARAA